MSNFQARLDAFFQGSASLQELEDAIDQLAPDPLASQHILESLERAFASGRLPTQIYHSLKSRVNQTDSGSEDSSLEVRPQADSEEPTIRPEPSSEKTKIRPQAASEEPAIQPQVVPEQATIRSVQKEGSRQGANEPTIQTETIDGEPGEPMAPALMPLQPEPHPVSDTPLDFEFPSQGSKVTGSNWSRPDQWRDSNLGPIQPGTVIKNRFTIESQLGTGGMGVVFKARDQRREEAQDSDPYVAIKIINEEFRKHPQSLIALQREASKAQTLAHPNIVTVYDFDRDGTTVYMTMELMRGESLSERIASYRRGGASREDAVPIIMEMAAGLAYAHKREIVHSDFKPGNVFLTDDNRVKVFDFGIARATRYARGTASDKTVFDAGDLGALTPAYASLEMLNGEPPHAADDVYALAVTAYQLLAGDHPYKRRTAAEAAAARLKPQPIKGLKRREWQAIARGLEFRRADRIQDAEEFLRQFRGPTRIAKSAAAAILILFGVASYFAYESFQEPAPPFPWTDLSAAAQADFAEKLASGRAWLDNDPPWIGGAFNDFTDAFEIHPRNPAATKGLRAVAAAFIEMAESAKTKKEKGRLLDDIIAVSDNEYLAEHKKLRRLKEALTEELNRP